MLLNFKKDKTNILIDLKTLLSQIPEEELEQELLERFSAEEIHYDDSQITEMTDEELIEECNLRGIKTFKSYGDYIDSEEVEDLEDDSMWY